jgi:hypothetical protein
MHAHTLGCMEACAICGDVRFVVLRRSSHTTAPTHLLQHLFAVVAQRLAGDEDDRSLGLRASTDGKARTLHAHEHVRSAHDVVRPQSPLLLLRTLSMKAAACLMMMWVRSSRTQMMTRRVSPTAFLGSHLLHHGGRAWSHSSGTRGISDLDTR